MKKKNHLLLGTRKGLIVYENNSGNWQYASTHFLAAPVSLTYVDPRNNTWWACLDHGHWGVKLHRSEDQGKSWEEIEAPAFEEGMEIKEGKPASVNYLWAMAHGGNDKPGVLYLGTDPGALFRSDDNGNNWQLVKELWEHPSRKEGWFGGGRDEPGIHSILVDPNNSDHIYIGVSVAGVFETNDGGKSWNPKNKGLSADFLPDPNAEVGQDPHLVVSAPANTKVMWQQNHCGIFVSEDGAANWSKVSEEQGPADFGFTVAVDDERPEVAWVIPGVSDELRVAVDQALCVCRTDDMGKNWKAFRKGLPQENCYDIVYRHALDVSGDELVFGTTTGNVYTSSDRGESWKTLSNSLPMVYSVEMA